MKTAYRWMAGPLAAVALVGGAVAWGQEGGEGMPPPGPGAVAPGAESGVRGRWGERMRGGEMGEDGMIDRLLNKPELTSQIGLTGEQIASLKKAVDELRKQQKDLRVEQEKAGLEQARLMLETHVDEQAVMAAVEKAGKVSTDIAKLRVKQLLVLRKTLTADQIEKMKEIMRQRVKKMQEEGIKSDRGMRGQDVKARKWKNPERSQEEGDAGVNRPAMPPPPPDQD